MGKKIDYLNEHRILSMEQVAKLTAQQYLDPAFLANVEEPKNFASGKINANGSFVIDGPDEIDEVKTDEKI